MANYKKVLINNTVAYFINNKVILTGIPVIIVFVLGISL